MFTIVWTYVRQNQDFPFFKETELGIEYQEITDKLAESFGSDITISREYTKNNLSFVTTFIYKDMETCDIFTEKLQELAPNIFVDKNVYLKEHNHLLFVVASEPYFRSLESPEIRVQEFTRPHPMQADTSMDAIYRMINNPENK